MAGEIQLNSTTMATESSGTIILSNVDSATNRQNLGLEIGVDVQQHDADTTKNDVANTFTANQIISVTDNTNAALRVTQLGTGNALVVEDETNPDSTPFVVDNSGNVGIGTSSPTSNLEISDSTNTGVSLTTTADSTPFLDFRTNGTDRLRISSSSATGASFNVRSNQDMEFYTNNTERMRIDTSGNLLVGKTSNNFGGAAGAQFIFGAGGSSITSDNVATFALNRLNSDGDLLGLYQASILEGKISVSGTMVSYLGGHLSRWSQLADNTRDESIVKGTVMSNLDQMAEWTTDGVTEDNEQLNCMKVSDVEGDINVAGVFVNWDNDDDIYTNDMNIAMTGDMVIRIAQGTTVQRGDLLMSAGDGTAKPQGDDIVRSKTIAKVTSTHVSNTYDDGSYVVPCVLMAC